MPTAELKNEPKIDPKGSARGASSSGSQHRGRTHDAKAVNVVGRQGRGQFRDLGLEAHPGA